MNQDLDQGFTIAFLSSENIRLLVTDILVACHDLPMVHGHGGERHMARSHGQVAWCMAMAGMAGRGME